MTATKIPRTASQLAFVPTGTIAATNVQAAIAEVASEAGAAASTTLSWFNVKDPPYNAVGGGVTNDTAAIQAAIDAATSVGGRVYFPQDSYKVTTLNMKQYVMLAGPVTSDAKGSILVGTAGSDIVNMPTSKSWMQFEHLQFTGGKNHIYSANGTTFVKIRNCIFGGPSEAALRSAGTSSIEEWYVRDCFSSGGQWFFKADAGTALVDKTTFENCHNIGHTNAYRIESTLSDSILWTNNTINSCNEHGVYIDSGAQGLTFINSNTEGNGQTGKMNRTTGSVSASSTALTLASGTGYVTGDPICVAGAGDNGNDLITTASLVSGTAVTLADPATTTVSAAIVTNAKWDDFHFAESIGHTSGATFLGGQIGGVGNGGKLRYSIFCGEAFNLKGLANNSDIPVYDIKRNINLTESSLTTLRRSASFVGDPCSSVLIGDHGQSPTRLPTGKAKNFTVLLTDDVGAGFGSSWGDFEVRRVDPNHTRILDLPPKGQLSTLNGMQMFTKAGTPTDGDFETTPQNGTIVVDTTASKIWTRIGGTWKGVAVA